ncbi:DNA primase [Rhodoplanes sp. TEM]|uniref:DNA primase n=1 Tax=Rhodoplanes tepidamans TaxID=200616 RepID=A0ABT5J9H4_RHOTP|nr:MULTISPECIES: DNA primase [Rhodoplanes]MDC7786153.1 DNA primase [Rhodoplanes tepidamans]MDC7982820.1 DNA primase [Rhodoplanes sp. TEM]MDQ0357182.1 DNA primase [Rhodoplanes tepidamans]
MRFPPEFLDDLRARLPVSEVVSRRVKLKKAGREWKGLSPFNKERTPSFFVNDSKGMWFDFSSGKNGNIFDFVMATEGLSFPEAVERLAGAAGLTLPRSTPEAAQQARHSRTLLDVVEMAAKYFEAALQSRAGARARGYLADRGLDPGTQQKFRIGYAPPDRFALKEHLGREGVSVEDMVEAGLLVAGDDIPVPYDRFRDRVMFPIGDLRGRVVAFGGRALDKDVSAKYLNSPETSLFHKGGLLYNGATARAAAHAGAPLIAVEGYVDVIAMVTAGFPGTVAPLGTSLTADQLALMWKIADEPVLCFDGDSAGRRAAYRAVDLALPLLQPGKSLYFATLPQGHDPDDLIRASGKGAMADVLAAARPLADILWMRETEAGRFDTPERRAGLEARLDAMLGGIANESVRKYYRADLGARLRGLLSPETAGGAGRYPARASGGGFRADFKGGGRGRGFSRGGAGRRPGGPEPAPMVLSPRMSTSPLVRGARAVLPPREALIVLSVLNHPWLLDGHAEEFAALDLVHPDADRLRRAILDVMAAREEVHADVHAAGEEASEAAAVRAAVLARDLGGLVERIEAALTHVSDWPARLGAAPEDVRPWWRHVLTLHHKNRTLNKELKEAERALGDEPSERNYAWLRDVQGRLAAIEGTEASIEGFGALSGRPTRGL